MKRCILLTILLLLAAGVSPAADERKLTGEFVVDGPLRILRLWGTPGERGFAHGYLLAKTIINGLDSGLTQALSRKPGFYEGRLRPMMEMGFNFSAAEEAELAGMLAGIRARLPMEQRKVPCLGRELDLVDLRALNAFGDWYALGCSSAALWGEKAPGGGPVVVRNFDFVDFDLVLHHQHVRIVAPAPGAKGEHGWVGVSCPGSIGLFTAMSSEGVFAAIHDVHVLPEMKDYLSGNVPRLLALRRIVAGIPAEGAVEKAAAACRGWNTLYGNNFLVATPQPAGGLPAGVLEYDTLEGRAKGVALRGPGEGASFVACSNHHRTRSTGASCRRYNALVAGCRAEREKPFDVPSLFALADLAAEPGPGKKVSESAFGTFHQVVAVTGTKRLWIRFVDPTGNIRDAEPVEFDVVALTAEAAARAGDE